MKIDWKDPSVRFGVGLTGIIILAWWYISGDIPFLSRFISGDTPVKVNAQGEQLTTAAGAPIFEDWLPTVKSMLFQGIGMLGGGMIAIATGVFRWLYLLINKPVTPPPVQAQVEPKQPAEAQQTVEPDSMEHLKLMGIASQKGDIAEVNKRYGALRRPFVIELINDAAIKGDKETMAKHIAELESLL